MQKKVYTRAPFTAIKQTIFIHNCQNKPRVAEEKS